MNTCHTFTTTWHTLQLCVVLCTTVWCSAAVFWQDDSLIFSYTIWKWTVHIRSFYKKNNSFSLFILFFNSTFSKMYFRGILRWNTEVEDTYNILNHLQLCQKKWVISIILVVLCRNNINSKKCNNKKSICVLALALGKVLMQ